MKSLCLSQINPPISLNMQPIASIAREIGASVSKERTRHGGYPNTVSGLTTTSASRIPGNSR